MLLPCLAVAMCCGGSGDGLRSAGRECRELADETVELAATAKSKGENAITYSNDIRDTLISFGRIDASTFVKIKGLIEDDKARKTLDLAGEMEEIATSCMAKAGAMTESLQRGVDSLPDPVKEDLEDEGKLELEEEEDEDAVAVRGLLDVDTDVLEVETSTRDVGSINIFTAARSGKEAFDTVAQKETVCTTIFGKIQNLSSSLARIASAFIEGNCCDQAWAVAAGGKELFQCLRFSKLIKMAAEAARKLIQAIIKFVKMSWQKFKGFLGEFDAAKRLGRFVDKINPMNTRIGQMASGVVGSLMGKPAAVGRERPQLNFSAS